MHSLKPSIKLMLLTGMLTFSTANLCMAEQNPPDHSSPGEVATMKPPVTPVHEDFEAEPKISLFPRIGDYRPGDEDSERLSYWLTFIKHVQKASGVTRVDRDGTLNRVYSFRSINSLDSVGFFTPLQVEPNNRYRVSFRIKTELPKGASAGVGVIEYDRFHWIGDQFSESFSKEHQRGLHEGVSVSGNVDWQSHSFVFRTGPETGMIHLIFYREGEHARLPVLLDDIEVETVRD